MAINVNDIDKSKAISGASTDAIKNFVKMVSDHRNLLDNWHFANPINQRGVTSGTSYGYMLDRWIFDYGTSSSWAKPSTDDYITIRPDGRLIQKLEPELITYLRGKTVTASIIDNGGVIHSGTAVVTTSSNVDTTIFNDGYAQFVIIYTGAILIYNRNGSSNSIGIKAVKLELGSVSTLQYDAPPNYAEELAKCKRYFQKIRRPCFSGYIDTSSRFIGSFVYPVAMRTFPEFEKEGGFRLVTKDSTVDISNLTARIIGTDCATFHVTFSTSRTVGEGALIEGLNAASSYEGFFYFDADL